MTALLESYEACEALSRRSASNLTYAFWLLSREKRRAMYALYAFSRQSDDIADDESQSVEKRKKRLAEWRQDVEAALRGDACRDPLLPALRDVVRKYEVPSHVFFDLLDGVAMDLHAPSFVDFDALRDYCRLVASAVGVACLYIWGFDRSDKSVLLRADACGIALQLTNILRDLGEDASRGRIYLPQDELDEHPGAEQAIRERRLNAPLQDLIAKQIERATRYFDEAELITPHLEAEGCRIFKVMTGTYRELLGEIKRRDGDVFSRRIRVSNWRRLRILSQAIWTLDKESGT